MVNHPRRFFSKWKAVVRDRCHTHVTGTTDEGKSYFLRMHFYANQRFSEKKKKTNLVLLDVHGDLAKDVKRFHLNVNSNRLIYISPSLKK